VYIGKEEMLAISGDYKLSVSVCFVSEHDIMQLVKLCLKRHMPEYQCRLRLCEKIFGDML
jgi:hypothetical protein